MARLWLVLLTLALGCSGEVGLRVLGEAYAEQGIGPGEIEGGWAIEFSEFVVSVDDVRLSPEGAAATSTPCGNSSAPLRCRWRT